MKLKLSYQPWLSTKLKTLAHLRDIGFQISDDDVHRLIKSAVIVEVEEPARPTKP